MPKLDVVAFTFLRNGIYYNYPFSGTLESLSLLGKEIVLALGDSHDDTEAALRALSLRVPLKILPTIWDENLRQGGKILSQQTNLALAAAREKWPNAWGFYLQCDELIAEQDVPQLRLDFEAAAAQGCDAIRFRYLHFWQSPDRIAVGKRWYAHEIRALRLDSPIESFGDAQSFRGAKQVYESDVPIYHYGHVREESAYKRKTSEFHRWWHVDQEIPKKIAAAAAGVTKEETIAFNGPHPRAIMSHLAAIGKKPKEWNRVDKLILFGRPERYSADFLRSLPCRLAVWTQNASDFLASPRAERVALENLPGIRYPFTPRATRIVPSGMRARGARPWPNDFRARLILASAGLGFVTRLG